MTLLSCTHTRNRLKEVLDTADQGVPVGVERHGRRVVMVDMARLAELSANSPRLSRAEAIAEANAAVELHDACPMSRPPPLLIDGVAART